jgi:hypothetical protein
MEIKDIFKQCGKSCADLARESGVDYQILNRYANGIYNLSKEDKAKVDKVIDAWTNRIAEQGASGENN